MAYAINIKISNESGAPIRALWDQASKFENKPSMESLSYPPHFTLAAYDEIEPEKVVRALENEMKNLKPIKITFDGIGHFNSNPLILWAKPSYSKELEQIHELIHKQIDPLLCRNNYRPGNWIPHCSLALNVQEDKKDVALNFANEALEPFEVTFDAIDFVSFRPIVEIKNWPLNH